MSSLLKIYNNSFPLVSTTDLCEEPELVEFTEHKYDVKIRDYCAENKNAIVSLLETQLRSFDSWMHMFALEGYDRAVDRIIDFYKNYLSPEALEIDIEIIQDMRSYDFENLDVISLIPSFDKLKVKSINKDLNVQLNRGLFALQSNFIKNV